MGIEELPLISRFKTIEANGGKPQMPDVYACEYILGYLWDIGAAEQGGMAPVELSAQEIVSWQHGVGIELKPWEFRFIKSLSRDYVRQMAESESPDCPAPYGNPDLDFDREIVGNKVGNAFKSFAQIKR